MSEPTAPRGRGRGRGRRIGGATLSGTAAESVVASPSPVPEARSRASTSASASATPQPIDTAATEDAPMGGTTTGGAGGAGGGGVKRLPSVGIASSRAPSVGIGHSRERSVGGLLGSQSQYKAGGAAGASGANGKPKFRPNVAAAAARRKEKSMQLSDDDEIKEEDDSGWKKRGPRPPRARQELEMTASGPMAQGPGGAPRTWGARSATASGAAVMNASREGTLNAQLNQDEDASDLEAGDDSDGPESRLTRIRATDLNDIGMSEGESEGDEGVARRGVPPLVLPRDPKVLRTKIRRLQERKTERLKKEARKAGVDQVKIKDEPREDSMSIDGTPNATPAPSDAKSIGFDSKESTFAGFEVDEKEAKDLKDLEEEEKKEINLSEAFDLKDDNRLDLYMFQFPRKFPTFIPKTTAKFDDLSLDDPKKEDHDGDDAKPKIKPDPESSGAQTSSATARKPIAPDWGRSGSRIEKAARWSQESGKIGKLRVHKSGKVTLKLDGDLRYEVLPAAQPSFLQEIAVLDHPAKKKKSGEEKKESKKAKKPKKRKSKYAASSSDDDSSDDSDDSDSGDASDSDDGDRKPRGSKKDPPPDSLVCIGQTSKKFIVVPEISDLLEKVQQQEKREKEEERKAKGARIKKEPAGGGKAK